MDNIEKKITSAELNLQRKLEWIGRFDTRITFIAGVTIAMLGILANACAAMKKWNSTSYISFVLASLLLLGTLVSVYKSLYPKTLAPNSSMIFFGTIGRMDFARFKTKFESCTLQEYLEDLLHQVHINSKILILKFKYLKSSLIMLGIGLIPWLIALYSSKIYYK